MSIVALKSMSTPESTWSTGRTPCDGATCESGVARLNGLPGLSKEADVDLEELLDLCHDTLVHHEHDDVIFGLDHDVVVRHEHFVVVRWYIAAAPGALMPPHDCADRRALRQIELLDFSADDLGRFAVSMRDELERLGRAAPQRMHRHAVAAPHARKQRADRRLGGRYGDVDL